MRTTAIAWQTLQNFTDILPEKKGIEKSLWVKKFIKRVDYSREEIALSLYYKGPEGAEHRISASGRAEENTGRNSDPSICNNGLFTSEDSLSDSEWLPDQNSLQTISIILPNIIHSCKKKNL